MASVADRAGRAGRPRYARVLLDAGAAALGAQLVLQVLSVRGLPAATATWGVVLAFGTAGWLFAAARCGLTRALAAAAVLLALGYAAEWIGTRTGWPFGRYHYTGELWPDPGGVPLVVPVAWLGICLAGYAVGALIAASRPGRLLAGALAVTAWDAFLDPHMLLLGYWRWDGPAVYRGVPATNFAGWLLVSLILLACLDRLLGPAAAGAPLLLAYTLMALMETCGFAFAFARDALVALVGGAAMGVPAALAWRAWWRRSRRRLAGHWPGLAPGGGSGRARFGFLATTAAGAYPRTRTDEDENDEHG